MKMFLRGSCAVLISATGVLALVATASAQEVALSVPITTVTRGAPGSLHVLGSRQSAELEGQTCDVVVEGDNNGSVHPNNDLIVSSETGTVELLDFERAAGAVTTADAPLTIGATLTLTLRLGDDIGPNGLVTSSGGATVSLVDCTTPEPPPTSPTTTPPAPPTVPPAQTLPPQIGTPVPATTLPHTGSELWIGIVGGIFLMSGLIGIAIGKTFKEMDR